MIIPLCVRHKNRRQRTSFSHIFFLSRSPVAKTIIALSSSWLPIALGGSTAALGAHLGPALLGVGRSLCAAAGRGVGRVGGNLLRRHVRGAQRRVVAHDGLRRVQPQDGRDAKAARRRRGVDDLVRQQSVGLERDDCSSTIIGHDLGQECARQPGTFRRAHRTRRRYPGEGSPCDRLGSRWARSAAERRPR